MVDDNWVPTLDQTIALSQIGEAHDRLAKVIRRALRLGVRPEAIVNFMDDPATQAANHVMRQIIDSELMPLESQIETGTHPAIEARDDDDTVDQSKISNEDDDTIVINTNKN